MFARRSSSFQPCQASETPESHQRRISGLLQEANVLGACSDPRVILLFQNLIRCPGDKHLQQLLDDALQPYRLRNSIDPDPFRPYPGQECGIDAGDMELGTIWDTGVPWRIDSKTIQHTVVTGYTGGGKTNALKVLMANLCGVLPHLMITPKTDMAQLLVDPPIIDGCFLFEELKLALFEPPPGEDPRMWHHAVMELFCRDFDLQLSRSHLIEACKVLREAYAAYSVAIGATVWFTPVTLLEKVRAQRGKYAESLVAALEILCAESYGVFDYAQGYSTEALFVNRASVLSMGAIRNEKVGRFLVDWLIEWLHTYYRLNGPYDGSPQFVVILDDAHQHLSMANER